MEMKNNYELQGRKGKGGVSIICKKWFQKKFKNEKKFVIFCLFLYTSANVFNRFQQFFHWLGKTAIIAIDMTKWNQNFRGVCCCFYLLAPEKKM